MSVNNESVRELVIEVENEKKIYNTSVSKWTKTME